VCDWQSFLNTEQNFLLTGLGIWKLVIQM